MTVWGGFGALGSANFRFLSVFFPAACFLSGEGFSVIAAVAWIPAVEPGLANLLPHPSLS